MSEIVDFDQLLYDVEALLRRDRRVAYRILKRRFALDDDDIDDLKAEFIDARRIALDEEDKVLVLSEVRTTGQRAERRQLTVMFCDIVGSTVLAERLDPEDLRELFRRYQQTCGQIIDNAHGHIAQYLGDGLLIYFGYPIAYEDAAVRAVSCGLGIIGAISKVATPDGSPLQVRIGIHTGRVVIGEVGAGEFREQLALGDTPNIAARIEAQAQPNEMLVSEATRRLLQDSFDYESRGETSLRGVATPIKLYVVRGTRDLRTRFEAVRQNNHSALAGRQSEIQKLHDAWEIAKQGNHSKYFIHSEPGIGKSRLVQEIRDTVRDDGGTPMTVVCTPLHTDTALYPFIELIQRVLRVRSDDPVTVKLNNLRDVLSRLRFPSEDTEDVLAALLSLKRDFGEAFATLDPQQRQQRTFDTILDWMLEVTTRTPVLLVIEDLQAADESTLDLVRQGLDRFEDTRTLMILVAREEFRPNWGRRGDIVDMPLRRLEAIDIRAIISGVCDGCGLPAALVDQIEAQCDGVPLYAEEFTKMVLESDLLVKNEGKYELVRAVANLAIPSSLEDSLMARLDRLADGKGVAQWGATIGREFSYELIQALLPDEVAANGLKELLDLGIIYKRKRTLQTTFLFKHALIRDAAYASLLRAERREYHARIARVLCEEFAPTVDENAELVARHLTSAERYEEATNYWLIAGQRAGERGMNKDGLAHFTNAMELLDRIPTGRARDSLELRLQMARGPLLMPLMGNGSPEVRDSFARALELCRVLNSTADRFPILFGLRSNSLASGDLTAAHDLSLELMHIAEESKDPGQLLEAHTALANTSFFRGDFIEVENQARAAMQIYDPKRFRHHVHVYGTDPGVLCLSRLSNASWQRGRPDRGRLDLIEMLSLAEELGHLFTLISALNLAALVRLWRCEPDLAFECADRAVRLSEQHGYPFPSAWGRMLRGQAIFDLGRHDDGMDELSSGYEATKKLSAKLMEPWFIAILANARIRFHQPREAYLLLDEAFQIVADSGTTYSLPTLHCLKGELLLADPSAGNTVEDSALTSFATAASIARMHGSRAIELRAVVGIVHGTEDTHEQAQTVGRLTSILAHFQASDDSKDLAAALAIAQKYKR
ncbi:MAG: class 3 adenylate cyclase [Gammaproteobacteria bacterium]|jgi:class 3 adenylate cyclase